MTSSSDNSSAAGLSAAFTSAEDDLKDVAFDIPAQHGTFTVWPADYEGRKYLKIHFEYTQGGNSYPIMIVAVAETAPTVGQLVAFARERTTAEFTFGNGACYFGTMHNNKIYMYYVTQPGTLRAISTWTVESISKTGLNHAAFEGILKHNAQGVGLVTG